MKKKWSSIVGLHNYLSNEINREDIESKEILKQLEANNSNLSKDDVLTLSTKAEYKEKLVEDGIKVLKMIEPYIKTYNRLRRHIQTSNAITVPDRKGNKILQYNDNGHYMYSIQGQIKMEDEIEDLLDSEFDFEPLVLKDNILLKNKDLFRVLKEFV